LLPGLLIIIAIGIAAVVGLLPLRMPAAVPASAPAPDFSSARALAHLQAIAQAPRPPGSPAHAQAREYLVTTLRDLGMQVEIQQTTAANQRRGRFPFAAGRVNNIIARLPGSASTRPVLLVAHYDTVPTTPGAADDGVGVAALVEAARALTSGPPPRNDIILLISDGEETGLLGATAFVNEHPLAGNVGLVLNFEARGISGPALMFETTPNSASLIGEFARAAPAPVASSLFFEVYQYLPNDTDFAMFKEAGIPGFNFAFIDDFLGYHSSIDTVARVDERSLQHHGSYALALARHFGALDLNAPSGGDAIFFNLVGHVLIAYPVWLAFPLLALAIALFVAVVVIGRPRGHVSFGGMAGGMLVVLLGIVAAAVCVTLLLQAIYALRPEYSLLLHGDVYNSKIYLIGIIACSIAVVAGLVTLFQRRVGAQNLMLGGAMWWLLLAIVTTLLVPGASYLFVWPALLGMLGLLDLFRRTWPHQGPGGPAVLALGLNVLPGVLLLAPIMLLIYISLTIRQAAVVAVLVVLLAAPAMAHYNRFVTRRRGTLPLVALLAGLGAIAAGVLTTRYDAERPLPDGVLYALDADTGQALWATADARLDEWTGQFFPNGAQEQTLDAVFPLWPLPFQTTQAPPAALAAPQLTVVEDRVAGEARTLRLRISSPRNAPMTFVYAGPQTQVLRATVDGKEVTNAVSATESGTAWAMTYWGLPPEGFELMLDLVPGTPAEIRVVDRTHELPELPGAAIRARPAHLAPVPWIGLQGYSNATYVSKMFKL
jgi:hypothetical protein